MINYNENILFQDTLEVAIDNRALNYGDALFETIKYTEGRLLFFEDHYFRLMASMRILRMEIPMFFTQEYFEEQIQTLINASAQNSDNCVIKLLVFRNAGGKYTPKSKEVSFLISVSSLEQKYYQLGEEQYHVALFKDFYIAPQLIQTLKTTNKAINVVGSIFAQENDYQNCLLLNTNKMVVEALNANLFLVSGTLIKTPPLSDGCLNGILRKQLIDLIKKSAKYQLEETSISPFELQKADELFITNTIMGIQPISNYRKKIYTNNVAKELLEKLNALI